VRRYRSDMPGAAPSRPTDGPARAVKAGGLPRCRELLAVTFTLAGLFAWGLPAAAGPAQSLVLEQKIPLGEVRGRIDHLAIDLARQRLFVAELGNNSLGVVDLAAGKVLRRIGGLEEPQGVVYDPVSDTVFVADAGDGLVHRFKGPELTSLDPIELGDDADNVRLAPEAKQVVVGYGEGGLALISAASGKIDGKIPLPGHPEAFALERNGPRIFVNVPDARQTVVVDRTTRKQVASWANVDPGANFPMALDEADGRLLTVYRGPALLAVFDTRSGAPVARLPACGDTDDVFLDPKRQRVYLSCGAGFVEVIQQRGDSYEELARIPTIAGARTSLFVPDRHRLYVAARASGGEGAAIWVFRRAS
jgi:DNA-binding beta-propeller fold protein YncE